MKTIHPRLVGAIFIVIYLIVGGIISLIFKINVFENNLYLILGMVIILVISIPFANKYYNEIVEEKKQEEEFFKKASENEKKKL